jgi:Effector Associated Constant Component 1
MGDLEAKDIRLDLVLTPENFDRSAPEWAKICAALRESLEADGEFSITTPKRDAAPRDAKGDPITIGALIIALASAPAVVKLINALNTWISNLGKRRVKMTIQVGGRKLSAEATGFSKNDMEELISAAAKALPKQR